MKLLTRYASNNAQNGNTSGSSRRSASGSLLLCLPHDATASPAPKRASFIVRLPYYIFLVGLAAVYYGYVISLNIEWMIIQQKRIWRAFIYLSIFHILFVMFMWALLSTVYRGPGAVGETIASGKHAAGINSVDNGDLEAGLPSEAAPLMQETEDPESTFLSASASQDNLEGSDDTIGAKKPKWRRRSSSRSHSSNDEEEASDGMERDYLEMQPKVDLGGDSEDDDSRPGGKASGLSGGVKKEVEIIYPGILGSSSLTSKANGKARYCRKCNVPKPDRAHHCSTCGFCVLKMDHHCPWIGGCVGFKNYKTFILFLFYGDLLAFFTCLTSLWALIQVLDMDVDDLGLAPVGWGFLVLFGFLFGVMLAGFFPYHVYLAVNNRSTIENMERNGRLLSLPARAETMLAAGVPDPHAAGLPERPKPGAGHLFLNQHQNGPRRHNGQHPDRAFQPPAPGFNDAPSTSHRQSNPFLPSSSSTSAYGQTARAGPSSSAANGSSTFESSALSSLSRMQKRELERKAGRINIYDLGTSKANFKQAFGADWNSLKAWIPVGTSLGTGYEWPVNKAHFDKLHGINLQLRGGRAGV